MIRYLKLYLRFIEFSFGKAMEFRVDFYFRVFMDLVFYAVQFGFFKIIFLHSGSIGGWNEQQAMIFIGAFITIDAIQMTVFANNSWVLPQLINKGDLDYYLVRPVSSFFMLNLRDFAFNSMLNLLMTFGFLSWAIYSYSEPLGFLRVFNLIILLFNGTLIFQFMRLLFILPVFWTHSSRGFDGMFWSLAKFSERPHGIYKGALRLLLFSIIPAVAIASVPTQTLFVDDPQPLTLYCVGIMFLTYLAVKLMWSFALRSYSSASS